MFGVFGESSGEPIEYALEMMLCGVVKKEAGSEKLGDDGGGDIGLDFGSLPSLVSFSGVFPPS